jgi:hypothetical protein
MTGIAFCHARCWAFIVLCWASAPSSGDVRARGTQRRDSNRPPAIVELDATKDLFAIGNAHWDYERLSRLLFVAPNRLTASTPRGAAARRSWSAQGT